jgi:signal transduction histidine kinase
MIQEETLRRGRILMVDDSVSSLCLLENVLGRLGFSNLRTLKDSTRILKEFDEYQPDLVITDLDMPVLDGIQLVKKLRAHLPPEAWLPILVLTGSEDTRAKRNALMAGATDILLKPFDSSELLMRLRNLVRARFQHIEIQQQNRLLEEKVQERTGELRKALTELQESQRQVVQQERFRAFGEMAGGVVHDFNNSLMSVIGYSDLLLQNDVLLADPELVRSYLQMMNTAGRDASHVVSRLRDFYRPREDSDVFTVIDLNPILEEVVSLTRPKWHDHALKTGRAITVELELQKLPLINGNAAELREVITNLIFNAVDAMPMGGTITLRSQGGVDGSAQIEVADTGSGMSEEVRSRCFEPFFSTKNEQGTGLGLSMSFGIIRRHDGTMEVRTAPGRGTTFRLLLPGHHRAVPASAQASVAAIRSLRVLVVDDDPRARDVITQYLRDDGHRVVTASSGVEAIGRVIAAEFDILITDHGMPGMNGYQLADAIRRIGTLKPIVLVSGFDLPPETKPTSVDCILKKPLERSELRETIQRLTSGGSTRGNLPHDLAPAIPKPPARVETGPRSHA